MQQVWAMALGIPIESIGADDDFFNLNGDSIAAMRLFARARDEGFNLRASDVFITPKLSELALEVQLKGTRTQSASHTRPFELLCDPVDVAAIRSEVAAKCGLPDPSVVEDVYPCTSLQESIFTATMKDPQAFVSMTLYCIPQGVDLRRLQAAWANVVARNSILRTRLVDLESHGLNQAVIQDQILWDRYSSTTLFLEDAWNQGMGLGSRLTRWALIKDSGDFRLVWIIHHAICDGWILPVIKDEVKASYIGRSLQSPQPDMKRLLKYLLKQDKESPVVFWDQELKEADEGSIFPSLPIHNYKPRPKSFLEQKMSVDFTNISAGIHLSTLLYGSWSLQVSRITGNQKVAFGAILTGRTAPVDGIDKLMGPTVTTVPILIDVDSSVSVQVFMTRLRNKTVRMMPHEHFGIPAIRRINAATAAACNYQTVLVIQPVSRVQDRAEEEVVMEELDTTQVEGFPNQYTKFNQYGLMMEILPNERSSTVRASFDDDLISKSQVARMISQWEHILGQLSLTFS